MAGPFWFSGLADAIYQNLNLIHDERPDLVCVFGADHIYRMDPGRWLLTTRRSAQATVAAIPVARERRSSGSSRSTPTADPRLPREER